MAGATAAQNEAMNNTDPHAADAAQNGGIATRVKNVVKDWLSFTFSNPGGSVNNWKNQFIGDMQRDFGRRTQPTDANRQLDPSGGDSDKGGPTAHAVVTAISAIGCMLTRGAACGLMTLPLASPVGAPNSTPLLSSGGSDTSVQSPPSGATSGPQNLGNNVRLYSDGSLRTPDGKFASVSGSPAPGTVSASQFADFLSSNGVNVVGQEVVVNGPLGPRRYDIVTQDANGALHGIEVKSGGATRNTYQEFSDQFVNRFGATGTGRFAGKIIRGSTTVYLP